MPVLHSSPIKPEKFMRLSIPVGSLLQQEVQVRLPVLISKLLSLRKRRKEQEKRQKNKIES